MSVMLLGVTSAVSQPAAAANLPHRVSSFVGREVERAEVAARLEETRLLTLTGVGGCGKTSLAQEVAREVGARFSDGVFWVELAPVSDPGLVAPSLARSVGVRPLPGETELDAVVAILAERRALVVLDNCEHLIERCAEVVEGLLLRCGAITVLTTSRDRSSSPARRSGGCRRSACPAEPESTATSRPRSTSTGRSSTFSRSPLGN